MIGEATIVLRIASKIEEDLELDVKRITVEDTGGGARVEMNILVSDDEKLRKVMKLLKEELDVAGFTKRGNILTVNGYIISGREAG